jgi:hypothetical protein
MVGSEDEQTLFKEKIEAASKWLFSSESATFEDLKLKLAELTYSLVRILLSLGILRNLFPRGKLISLPIHNR